eukprot:jgi/Mesen1/9914/ME000070S09198
MGHHNYGEADYWNDRYENDSTPFDWYQKYDALIPLFQKYLKKDARLLMVGCGNAADMAEDGFTDIWNVDISPIVIEKMRIKDAKLEALKVLRRGGVFIMITYGDPRVRMPHLEQEEYSWTVKLHAIPRPGVTKYSNAQVKSFLDPLTVSEKGKIGEHLTSSFLKVEAILPWD